MIKKSYYKSLAIATITVATFLSVTNYTFGETTSDLAQITYKNSVSGYDKIATERVTDISTEDVDGVLFQNISSTPYGGAIYNNADNSTVNITSDFIGNYSISNLSSARGGAIYNAGTIGDITGNFIDNYIQTSYTASGGAICNWTGKIGLITGNFTGNKASSTLASSQYIGAQGGAILNGDGEQILKIKANFENNNVQSTEASALGGAIANQGSIGDITGNFIGNYGFSSSSAVKGGAIYSSGTIGNIAGDFIGNYIFSSSSSAGGGAIYNAGTIGDITGNFVGNKATSTRVSFQYIGAQGGAIHNNGTIGNITGDFIGNYASSLSAAYGGAISNQGSIDNITGDFVGNNATSTLASSQYIGAQGGAIYNSNQILKIKANFENNNVQTTEALAYGGAIGNSGTIGSIEGDFIGNYSISNLPSARGGAIYNKGIIENIVGDFVRNYVSSKNSTTYGGAISNSGTIGNITGDFIGNYASSLSSAYGGAISNLGSIDNITGDFIGNYAQSSSNALGGVIANSNNKIIGTIKGNFINNHIYSEREAAQGSVLFNAGKIDSITGEFKNNYSEGAGTILGAITNSGTIGEIVNSSFYNNRAINIADGVAHGGAIWSKNDINLVAKDGYTSVFSGNYVEDKDGKRSEAIYMNKPVTLTLDTKTKAKFILNDKINGSKDGYNIVLKGDNTGSIYLNNNILNSSNVSINDVTVYANNPSLINSGTNLAVNSGALNFSVLNNQNYAFNSLTNTGTINIGSVDVDMQNASMGRLSANSYGDMSGNINVQGLNILTYSKEEQVNIPFADQAFAKSVNYSGQTEVVTPIYKYSVSYLPENGQFMFVRGGGSSSDTGSFNPAVLPSLTTANVGATGTMNQTMNYAFQNSADYMNIPYLDRISLKNRNKYALSVNGDATDVGRFSPLYQPNDEEASAWVKSYAMFETVGLKNGPKVHNNTYGTLIGFDTEMQSLRRGWDRVLTGYIGYNGASQRYSGIDSTQNGGFIGGTVTMYRGNFFNATTVSVGANVAQNDTMYGRDNFVMLLSGIGNKTGYNIEFKDGKFILQPNMLMSYTFVNTFDYTNAAGIRIDNKPLHAIQLAPGIKVIGNLKDGWQPYASVSMVWNLMGKSEATANGIKLPEMSIKPYVQYGVGLQKRIKDRFTAYGQAMIQNGGRNGISLTAGFRWAVGRDDNKIKNKDKKVEKKTLSQSKGTNGSKKIIKQMSTQQKAALYKTTNYFRSARTGSLRQL